MTLDLINIARILHAERPPKCTRVGGGVSAALWAKWLNVVNAFAEEIPRPSVRAAFLAACEVDGKAER
jgi:hypothetical protein